MIIDRGSEEVEASVKTLVVCGDAIVTMRGEVREKIEVLEAATLKLYGNVAGDVEVNTAGRVDVFGTIAGALRVEAGTVRVMGEVREVTGSGADGVKLGTGCMVGGVRKY